MRRRQQQGVKSISEKVARVQVSPRVVVIRIVSVLLLIPGVFFSIPAVVVSTLEAWGSLNSLFWEKTPCMIESSRVLSNTFGRTTRYRADIQYTYTHGDKDWSSHRHSFERRGYSSYFSEEQAIVDRYPPGMRTSCYVNPYNPGHAVLDRFSWRTPLRLLYVLPLFGGIAGLRFASRLNRSQKMERTLTQMRQRAVYGILPPPPPAHPKVPDPLLQYMQRFAPSPIPTAHGRYQLTSATPPRAKLLIAYVVTFFALVWSVPSWLVFIGALSGGLRSSGGSSLGATFLSGMFVLVGLGIFGGAVYMFLSARNPYPTVTLNVPSVSLGSTADLEWTIAGAVRRIERLTITLKGAEKATYTRGTQTVTEKSTFYTACLVEVASPREIALGRAVFAMPKDTMPSFRAGRNAVDWSLHVHGTILRWPDINEDFPVSVVPAQQRRPVKGTGE